MLFSLVTSEPFEFGPTVYLGGVDPAVRLPWHLWTAGPGGGWGGARGRGRFYRGCVLRLAFEGAPPVDLEWLRRAQRVPGVVAGCVGPPRACAGEGGYCGRGVCRDRWEERRVCDCEGTEFTGETCSIGELWVTGS